MTKTDAELREWRASLEQVTSGPWHAEDDSFWVKAVGKSIALFCSTKLQDGKHVDDDEQDVANQIHCARCDPQTIGALIDEVLLRRDGAPIVSQSLDCGA